MNRKIKVFAIVAVFILSSSAIALANGIDSALPWMHKADEQVAKMIHEKELKYGPGPQLPIIEDSGYDLYIKKAVTQEQKNAILALEKDNSIGLGEWTRDALEIIGELPKDARRINLEDAERINKEYKDDRSKIKAFNEIAGAPDFQGGSGIHRTIYYLDGNHKEFIIIIFNEISHYVVNENGKEIRKPLKGDMPTPEPQPTTLPIIK